MIKKLNKFKWATYSLLLLIGIVLNFHQNMIEQYMGFILRNEHIIVTFSTTPNRIHEIEPTVQTILKQNIKVDGIYIAIPYVFKRDNTPYEIPAWLQKQSKIKIIRTDDYGPATKLLGVIKHVKMPNNAIIITVDDDINYPRNTILQLAYKAKQYPNAAIGISAVVPNYDENGILIANKIGGFTQIKVSDAHATILQGFAGVAYRRNFFDDDIYEILNSPRECINADDVYLSYYLARHNIDRIVLKNRFIDKLKIDYDNDVGLRADALHQLIPTPSDKHRTCIGFLRESYPNVTF